MVCIGLEDRILKSIQGKFRLGSYCFSIIWVYYLATL